MQSINVLTINEELGDLVKIVEDAKDYFPAETWDEIRYLGKISLEHDVRITTSVDSLEAFLFQKLIERVGKIRDSERLMNVLLGITPDPIVAVYYSFDGRHFKRTVCLVHDYVAQRVGVVSLFRVNSEASGKVVAHGLGHNRGLRHHVKPIDLMYANLLRCPTIQVEGFCEDCLDKLTKDQAEEQD